jgi:biopolymer transport protein ExbB
MTAFLKFLGEEWYFAGPMLLLSFVALTLVLWRLFLNLEADTNLDVFLPSVQERLARNGIDRALAYCRTFHGMIPSRLYVAGLEASSQGLSAVRRAMAHAVELEILPQLNFLLAPILAIAKTATMIGLLGTVISMIHVFTLLNEAGTEGAVLGQSAAIGLALFATALGLIIAIPLVFAHVLFKAWLARFETKLKSAAQKLLVILESARVQPPPAADAPVVAASLMIPPPVRAPRPSQPASADPPREPLPPSSAKTV